MFFYIYYHISGYKSHYSSSLVQTFFLFCRSEISFTWYLNRSFFKMFNSFSERKGKPPIILILFAIAKKINI